MRYRSFKLFAPFLIFSVLLSADESALRFPTYTVTATRIEQSELTVPYTISRIDQDHIQTASQQLSLDEGLQTVPGIFILNPNNFAQDSRIAIRGFGARANFGIRGIRLIVDGIPATTPDGQGSVDGLDFGSIGSIEVLRGPAASLYGAASGGTILIKTEAAPAFPFAETRWTVGEFGLLLAQFKAAGRHTEFSYVVNTSHLDFDGFRDHNETENTRFNSKFSYDFSEQTRLTAVIHLIDLPLQNDPGALTEAQWKDDRDQARQRNIDLDGGESVQQEQIGLIYEHRLDDVHSIETKGYYTHRDFENSLPFATGGQVAFERKFYGGAAIYRFAEDRLRLATGLEYDLQNDDRQNYDNLSGEQGALRLNQKEHIESIGVFASLSYELQDELTVSTGVRHDHIMFDVEDLYLGDGNDSGKRRFKAISPRIGIAWESAPQATVFANLSTGFETPTSTELANPNGGGFNPNLGPQNSTSLELGFKGYSAIYEQPLRYEITLFHIDIEDSLVPFELTTDPGRDFFRNAGASTRVGIEAALQLELLEGLTTDFSYTWSNFDYDAFETADDDFSGNHLPGIPKQFANLQLNYKHDSGFFLRWNTRYVGSFYADDANSQVVDSYVVSSIRAGYTYRKDSWTLEPFVGVDNLFDQNYGANIRINGFGGRYYEPAPGRNFFGGIRLRHTFD